MGDVAEGVSDELANLRSRHSELSDLAGVCTTPDDWTRHLKIPESVMGGKDIEMVLGNFSAILSR